MPESTPAVSGNARSPVRRTRARPASLATDSVRRPGPRPAPVEQRRVTRKPFIPPRSVTRFDAGNALGCNIHNCATHSRKPEPNHPPHSHLGHPEREQRENTNTGLFPFRIPHRPHYPFRGRPKEESRASVIPPPTPAQRTGLRTRATRLLAASALTLPAVFAGTAGTAAADPGAPDIESQWAGATIPENEGGEISPTHRAPRHPVAPREST